jgi:hypothetical protein
MVRRLVFSLVCLFVSIGFVAKLYAEVCYQVCIASSCFKLQNGSNWKTVDDACMDNWFDDADHGTRRTGSVSIDIQEVDAATPRCELFPPGPNNAESCGTHRPGMLTNTRDCGTSCIPKDY